MMKWTKRFMIVVVAAVSMQSVTAFAQQSSSSNYGINEYFIGPGGDLDMSSNNYSARATLGDLGVGNFSSANYQLYAGFTTTDEPFIEFAVSNTTIDMGVLDAATTGTGTATFNVRTYLAEGYVVHAAGTLPTNESGDTISGMAKGASAQGTEQFGFNLWTNNSPTVFGAQPQQIPDSTFSFGAVDNEYNDDGQFKYSTADTVASSSKSSGETLYTVSYIMNVSPITEAGLYTANQTFVATSTY